MAELLLAAADFLPLLENPNAPEIFCTGLARLELLGPNVRLLYCVEHMIGGHMVREVNLNVIRPIASMGTAHQMFNEAIAAAAKKH